MIPIELNLEENINQEFKKLKYKSKLTTISL